MLRKILQTFSNNKIISNQFRFITEESKLLTKFETYIEPKKSVLEDNSNEDISHIATYLAPTFNFAAYINKSETLKQLVNLGVDLYKLEKNPDVPPFLLRLKFEEDIAPYIRYLVDLGVSVDKLGRFFTKNPFILKENLDDLIVRVNYLRMKNFNQDMIVRIVETNPFWLNISTRDIDNKLGFFQKKFKLTGSEVRSLATKRPQLITYNQRTVSKNIFVLEEEMGFSKAEMKSIILSTPTIFSKNQNFLLKTFEFLHKTMEIPLETIVKTPEVLTCREFRLKQRYLFLKKLGKTQFDAKQPNYVPLIALVSGTDGHFCAEICGVSVNAYNKFLKTL